MPTDQERLLYLFDKYLRRICTPDEAEELTALITDKGAEDVLGPDMMRLWERAGEAADHRVDWASMYRNVTARRLQRRRRSVRNALAAAAAGVLLLSAGTYYWSHRPVQHPVAPSLAHETHDVAPGGNKAVLTLGNGTHIILDKAANGTVASLGQTRIVKVGSGQLSYEKAEASEAIPGGKGKAHAGKEIFNTLTTPPGGQFRLTLSDGTQVWLNSASSLRFPAVFSGNTRQVEMTGEAYFEVAADAMRPFSVITRSSSGQSETVKVLGTHFNISAYPSESIKTTLLEGSVQVESSIASRDILMKPGQQVLLDSAGGLNILMHADVDEAVGWKNGLFVFHDDNLPEIMRRLSRWYDVQVEYRGERMPSHFTGTVRRQENISEVLKMLELTGGARFSVSGKKVTVIY